MWEYPLIEQATKIDNGMFANFPGFLFADLGYMCMWS
jgi:hypothetical protein